MTSQILIGVGGLILAVLTYFAGVHRTEKRLSKEERSNRIQQVFNRYMEFRRTNNTAGLDGLQRSGVAILKSDEEIRELTLLIVKHAENNPLGNPNQFDNVNLKKFFDYTAKARTNFFSTTVDDIINKSNSKV